MTSSTSSGPPPRRGPVRVLVAASSEPDRRQVLTLLRGDRGFELAGVAVNGKETIEAAKRLRPDVVVMYSALSLVSAADATGAIMHDCPAPIVVVVGEPTAESRKLAENALRAGALAILPKPAERDDTAEKGAELLRMLRSMAQVKVIHRRRALSKGPERPPSSVTREETVAPRIVAIGASTGGPQALQTILTALPAGFPLPVLVVQHIAAGFESSLVSWLAPQCALPVRIAECGAPAVQPGIAVAPTGRHLLVRNGRVFLSDAPPMNGHRPSATVLFGSVAGEYGSRAIGVLLSGMGEDGAQGLRDLRAAGGLCIAQDKASSVVFGMPGAAISLGAAEFILSPARIAALLSRYASPTGVN